MPILVTTAEKRAFDTNSNRPFSVPDAWTCLNAAYGSPASRYWQTVRDLMLAGF